MSSETSPEESELAARANNLHEGDRAPARSSGSERAVSAESGNRSIFTDPAAYADFDGWHERAAALRSSPGPIRIEDPGFAPFWAVVHHADVKDVGQRSAVFKNAPHPILVPGADREGGGPPVRNLVGMDDEEHRIYRGLISEWFVPGAIRRRKAE